MAHHSQILAFIREFRAERGYSPTIREIGAAVGIDSTSLVSYYLDQMQERGVIRRDKNIARSIVIVNKSPTEAQHACDRP
jgi:repressor LexA